MKALTGCMAITGALWLVAMPALAAEACMAPAPELSQMAQRATVDEVTRGKIDSLLHDAAGLCDEGATDKAQMKFANIRQLLDSDVPGQVAPKVAPQTPPNTVPQPGPSVREQGGASQ
jgi:hypothetical protein